MIQLLLLAKAPVPGRVKTRLCPPWTQQEAALVAAAALRDTIDALSAVPAVARTLVLDNPSGAVVDAPPGWRVLAQRGGSLDERIAAAFLDAARPGVASLLVGMDTPQLTPEHLNAAADALSHGDAVVGPALDGGWWLLGLRDPVAATAVRGVPMSTAHTGEHTMAALHRRGLTVATTVTLRDVDTAADAVAVAADHRHGRFARAVASLDGGVSR
ncbi:TIGR04282 family arsenosugar biosynthesis glycosyltransferase [Dactylosporangium sp. NPDC005555]|uniref:TIGR04282 family arsenosugar biosynthesis glycosyltransferase n=1 Tax=Dactylosporangium sp. NPDC005555 TaxID=3154889 RepID=UPI0033A29239